MEQSCKAASIFNRQLLDVNMLGGALCKLSSHKYAQAKLVLDFGGLREVAQAKDLGPQGKRWGSEPFF